MANNNETRDVVITLKNGQALSSIKELQGAMRKLRKEFRETSNEGKRKEVAAQMKKVNAELSKQYALTRATGNSWKKLNATIMKMGGFIAGAMGFQVITDQIGNLIRRNAQLSDSLADVRKTTGLSEEQVKSLDQSLRKIDTRSSRRELLQLARDAGKLGKTSAADIKKFVEQADKINVALGEDLGDQALVTIGKLSNIFKTDMLNIASSINTVGASSEASEPALVEFLSRLGGIANTAKLSAPDIIGYGATLDSLGLKAEMSTTALNTFFIDFIKNAEEFGAVAGFAEGELSKLIGTEGTNAGFVAFLEKLRQTHPEQKQFLEALEQMGVDGARGSQVFLTLANNTELLRKQQDIANESFEKGTSVLDEFNVKNNNFAANLNRVQKALAGAFMSNSLVSGIENVVNLVADYVRIPLSKTMEDQNIQMNVMVGKILELNEGNTTRKELIDELVEVYPDLLSGIDKETVSNEQLSKRLKEVNEQMINRIIIQRKQEQLDKQNETVADAKLTQMETEQALREQMARMAKTYNVELESGMSLQEKAAALSDAANAKVEKSTVLKGRAFNSAANDANKLRTLMMQLNEANAILSRETEESNKIFEEKEQLMKDLNIVTQEAIDLDIDNDGGNTIVGNEEQNKKVVDRTLDFIKQLQDAKIDAINDVEQRSIAAAAAEYQRKKEEVENAVADEDVKQDLLEQLYKDFLHAKAVIHKEATEKRIEEEKRQVEAANDSELLTLQLKFDVAPEGSVEQLDAAAALLQKQMELELANETLTTEQKELIQRDYVNRLNALWDEYWGNRKDKAEDHKTWEEMNDQERIEAVRGYLDQMEQLWSTLTNAISDMYAQQLQTASHEQDAELMKAEEDLAAGLITEEQFEQKKLQIKEKYQARERALKRAQFETERAAAIGQGMISMAQGILVAIESSGPLAAFTAAIVSAMALAQIAAISSQPNPYYKGGRTSITDTEGNRHYARNIGSFADGGYFSTPSYGVIGERGEELVVPNYVLNSPDYQDSIAHIESAIARGYASGGRTTSSSSGSPEFSSVNTTQASSTGGNQQLIAVMKNTNALLADLRQNGINAKALWDFQDFLDGVAQMEDIDNKKYLVGDSSRKPGQRI